MHVHIGARNSDALGEGMSLVGNPRETLPNRKKMNEPFESIEMLIQHHR